MVMMKIFIHRERMMMLLMMMLMMIISCPINRDALQFLSKLGRRLAETTADVRASSFLFQRISVPVQRFNSVLLHDGFVDDYRPE